MPQFSKARPERSTSSESASALFSLAATSILMRCRGRANNRTDQATKIMKTRIAVVIATLIAGSAFTQSPGPTMKAIVVHEFGGPEVLKYEDAPRPEPKEDEVLIRVMAAGVNPVDAAIRAGRFHGGGGKLPFIPGMDVAGVVEKTGT